MGQPHRVQKIFQLNILTKKIVCKVRTTVGCRRSARTLSAHEKTQPNKINLLLPPVNALYFQTYVTQATNTFHE